MKFFGKKKAPSAPQDDSETGLPDGQSGTEGTEKARGASGFLARLRSKRPSAEDGDDGTGKRQAGGVAGLFKRLQKNDPADEEGAQALDSSGLEEILPGRDVDISFDGSRLLEIGSKKVLIGLLWDTVRSDESIRAQAASLSDDRNTFDFAAHFRDGNQLGFASSADGGKPGIKAGVTCFRQAQMGKSWLAAFRLGSSSDYYWVVAQRNGAIYEDQVLQGADEARMVFLENLEAPDWQRTIAPEDWEIGGTEFHALADVIDPGSGIGLKPTNPMKTYLPRIIASAVLVVVMVIGWFVYQNYLEEQKRLAEELKRQREAAVRVAPSDYPWFDAPDFSTFIDGCYVGIEKAFRVIPGWRQDLISCSLDEKAKNANIQTSWANTGKGTVPWLRSSFSPGETQPSIRLDGSTGILNDKVEFNARTEVLAEPWEPERIERILRRRIQTTGVEVKMSQKVQRITPAQQLELRKPIFNYHSLSFKSSTALKEYARLFGDVPALVPESIVYDVKSGTMTVAFRIYHPAILPLTK